MTPEQIQSNKAKQMQLDSRIISALLELRFMLKEAENIKDSKLAERYRVARLDIEKSMAYFDTFVLGSNRNLAEIINTK